MRDSLGVLSGQAGRGRAVIVPNASDGIFAKLKQGQAVKVKAKEDAATAQREAFKNFEDFDLPEFTGWDIDAEAFLAKGEEVLRTVVGQHTEALRTGNYQASPLTKGSPARMAMKASLNELKATNTMSAAQSKAVADLDKAYRTQNDEYDYEMLKYGLDMWKNLGGPIERSKYSLPGAEAKISTKDMSELSAHIATLAKTTDIESTNWQGTTIDANGKKVPLLTSTKKEHIDKARQYDISKLASAEGTGKDLYDKSWEKLSDEQKGVYNAMAEESAKVLGLPKGWFSGQDYNFYSNYTKQQLDFDRVTKQAKGAPGKTEVNINNGGGYDKKEDFSILEDIADHTINYNKMRRDGTLVGELARRVEGNIASLRANLKAIDRNDVGRVLGHNKSDQEVYYGKKYVLNTSTGDLVEVTDDTIGDYDKSQYQRVDMYNANTGTNRGEATDVLLISFINTIKGVDMESWKMIDLNNAETHDKLIIGQVGEKNWNNFKATTRKSRQAHQAVTNVDEAGHSHVEGGQKAKKNKVKSLRDANE